MDAQITVALINLAAGGLGVTIAQGIWKWLRGYYNAVQEAEDRAEALRRKYEDLRHEYNYLRAWILAQPLSVDQLERVPKPPDHHQN